MVVPLLVTAAMVALPMAATAAPRAQATWYSDLAPTVEMAVMVVMQMAAQEVTALVVMED